jgi:hypothetical protein
VALGIHARAVVERRPASRRSIATRVAVDTGSTGPLASSTKLVSSARRARRSRLGAAACTSTRRRFLDLSAINRIVQLAILGVSFVFGMLARFVAPRES